MSWGYKGYIGITEKQNGKYFHGLCLGCLGVEGLGFRYLGV